MATASHLRSLQALDMAIREGSLKQAAARLGITPAAVGQRIRALEDFLGSDLLVRGRSGLHPTVELNPALADLRNAFDALDRVTETLDFQRVTEVHIVADPDWAALWLEPRLKSFKDQHPNILFNINGAGDVRMRLGAPDLRIEYGDASMGEALYRDVLLPVCGPDNLRRVADYDEVHEMEGLPLLHLEAQRDDPDRPGWREWFTHFGLRHTGVDRGVHYRHARQALEATRQEVGFLLCGLSLIENDLDAGQLVLVYPADRSLQAPHAYRVRLRNPDAIRPQIARFIGWLKDEAQGSARRIDATLRSR